jgi:peptidoglycan/xylan/chitin deacetylase (PgdA/CDA1 family)
MEPKSHSVHKVLRGRTLRAAVERVADMVLRATGLLAVVRRLDLNGGQVLRVLTYHRVADWHHDPANGDPGVISATPEAFAEQVRLLARHYEPIGAGDLEASLAGGRALPRRAVLVTFDDGYQDFRTNAWPALKSHAVPAIVFVATAYPDGRRLYWWDELWQMVSHTTVPEMTLAGVGRIGLGSRRGRLTAMSVLRRELRPLPPQSVLERMGEIRRVLGVSVEPAPAVLGWEELRALAKDGVSIASHGRSHASTPSLTEEGIAEEVDGSLEDLKRELGVTVRIFAYPYGHYDHRAANVLKARGFVAAFSTGGGVNLIPFADPYAISRQSVNAGHSFSRVQLGLSGFYPRPIGRLLSILRPRAS